MLAVALKMLLGDRAKVLGLISGVAFATLLVTQQSALFMGLMVRAQNVIADARGVDIWVMDPAVEYLDLVRPMRDSELFRVRGVPGVATASRFFKGATAVKTATGKMRNALLLGVDEATWTGVPRNFVMGSLADLQRPDAIAIDRYGFAQLWPAEPLSWGKTLELNDRRAIVTAITDAAPAFAAQVIIYTRYSQAINYLPNGRNQLSFVLTTIDAGANVERVAERISQITGLRAETADGFSRRTVSYYLRNTGITMSFVTTIALGAIVGCAIVGLTFSLFVAANLPQYALLKIIGITNARILHLVLFQASVIVFVGYWVGMALATSFFHFISTPTSALRGFFIPWWIAAYVAAGVTFFTLLAISTSLRRVLLVDPTDVFRS